VRARSTRHTGAQLPSSSGPRLIRVEAIDFGVTASSAEPQKASTLQ
jgi:hypothetical protein